MSLPSQPLAPGQVEPQPSGKASATRSLVTSPTQDPERAWKPGQANLGMQGSLPEPSLQSAFLGPDYITSGNEGNASRAHCVGSAGAVPCRSLGGGAEMLWELFPTERRAAGPVCSLAGRDEVWTKELRDGSGSHAKSMGAGLGRRGATVHSCCGEVADPTPQRLSAGKGLWEEGRRGCPVRAWAEWGPKQAQA